jgi:hypothetical protein
VKLRLSDASPLALPIDVAGEAIAILAKRGAGKTNTATVLVEEMVTAGVQTVILDPVGAWWGIRSDADGDGPGLEIPILGGAHGDVPLEQTAGALIADVVVDSGQSLLLDLSDFPSKAAADRFVTDFAERLFRRKARDHSAVHLVLEEADTFAPQKVRGSERMQGAIEQIVRRGRSRGLGVTLITQRSAVLSKDVLTQADVLIVMRTTGPHDLRAIGEWVASRGDDQGRTVLASLPGMATGEAWIWNPERDLLELVKIRPRSTFDSSRTPRAGEKRSEPKGAASIDIAALGAQIAATAEKVKADDPKTLRARIAELEKDLQHSNTVIVEEVKVEVPVFNGEPEKLLEAVSEIVRAVDDFGKKIALLGEAAAAVEKVARDLDGRVEMKIDDRVLPKPVERPRARPVPPPPPPPSDGSFSPTVPQQRVLDAIAWLASIGLEGDRQRVAFLSEYRVSGNFNNLISKLNTVGAISYPRPGVVALTELGARYAIAPREAPTSEHIHQMVLEKLAVPQRRVLEVLIENYPHAVRREDLAGATGYRVSGNFNNIVSKLSSLGVANYPSPGYVAADPVLFIA